MTIWNGTLSLSILFSTTKNYFYFIFGVGISFVNSFWNVHASASGKQQHRTGPGKSNIASHRDGCSSTFSFCSFASDTSLMDGWTGRTDGQQANMTAMAGLDAFTTYHIRGGIGTWNWDQGQNKSNMVASHHISSHHFISYYHIIGRDGHDEDISTFYSS